LPWASRKRIRASCPTVILTGGRSPKMDIGRIGRQGLADFPA
jgi:hypothetical protein